jgi:hypothetical protein
MYLAGDSTAGRARAIFSRRVIGVNLAKKGLFYKKGGLFSFFYSNFASKRYFSF